MALIEQMQKTSEAISRSYKRLKPFAFYFYEDVLRLCLENSVKQPQLAHRTE
jgi:hypothetical protein